MTRVKICGITNLADALLAVKYGADELGFNFYEHSPRYVSTEKAAAIADVLPAKVSKVGVFVNAKLETICGIAKAVGLTAIQLHGDEDWVFIENVREKTNLTIIKAIRVSPATNLNGLSDNTADAILLDSYSENERGGTGDTFDWDVAKRVAATVKVMYLAGGLTAENVCEAIRKVRPYAVDVCSRIESEPGKKDEDKLRRFISAVRETV